LGVDADYVARHVRPEHLSAFADEARRTLKGFNITVPHKGAVIPLLDGVSDAAKLAGSVNTVSVIDGRLYGESTDGYGLEKALEESFGVCVRGSSFCLIGCGGAAQAAAFHFAAAGAAKLFLLNRTLSTAQALAGRVSDAFPATRVLVASLSEIPAAREFLESSQVAVQCTSLGLKPDDPPPLSPEMLPDSICLYETIYRRTALLSAAEARGLRCANGLSMLLHQGAKSLSLWLEMPAPLEAMRKALYEAFARAQK
jgi:shikimate dehydrogenase